jgi:hypothetical protein
MWCDFWDKWTKVMKIDYKCYIQIMSYVHENVLLHVFLGDILTTIRFTL